MLWTLDTCCYVIGLQGHQNRHMHANLAQRPLWKKPEALRILRWLKAASVEFNPPIHIQNPLINVLLLHHITLDMPRRGCRERLEAFSTHDQY
jgi:hypothetical protein